MTVEPPRGIKANLLKSFIGFTDEFLDGNVKVLMYMYHMYVHVPYGGLFLRGVHVYLKIAAIHKITVHVYTFLENYTHVHVPSVENSQVQSYVPSVANSQLV